MALNRISVLVALAATVAACQTSNTATSASGQASSGGTPAPATSMSPGGDSEDSTASITDGATSSTGADSGAVSSGPAPVTFDIGIIPDAGNFGFCTSVGGPDKDPEFSYLWAANSSQGTISKLDTQTVTEVGRYIVRPDSAGSPSRTSVSLSGNVAVANRNGGVTKIYADAAACPEDNNGINGIQTSFDNVALPWGQDDCVAWHTPFNYTSQRPLAWVQGEFNKVTCEYENELLWTSGKPAGGGIEVLLLDGDDGTVLETIPIVGMTEDSFGIYGGAVDGEGNFWGSQLGGSGRLVRVLLSNFTYEIWQPPNNGSWYGMTVDSDGYVWLCSSTVARFEPVTETWTTASVGGYTGCMADAGPDGLLWMSSGFNGGVVGINRQTLAVEQSWVTPGSYGVSIDFYGYIWTVANGSGAHRVDPVTGDVVSYNGLVGAYTYSDMTGFALSHAGGGVPSG